MMHSRKRSYLQHSYVLLLPFLLSLSVLFVVPGITTDLIRYGLFFTVLIGIPAYWLSELLLNKLHLSFVEKIVFGFVPSMLISLSLYWIGIILGVPRLPLLLLFSSLANIVWKITKQKPDSSIVDLCDEESSRLVLWVVASYVLAVGVFFVLFTISTALPLADQVGSYYQDSLWTVSNTWAIIREGVPVQNSRFFGLPFSYHMAQNVFQAFTHEFTGIDPFHIHFHIEPFYTWFFIVATAIFGGKAIAGWSVQRSVIWSLLLFFSAASFRWWQNGYMGHLYYNPLSTFYGFAPFLLFILLMYRYTMRGDVPITFTVMVIALVFATKASFVFVIPLSLVFFLVIRVLSGDKIGKQEILIAVGLVVVAILLKISIYGNAGAQSLSLNVVDNSGRVSMVLSGIIDDPPRSLVLFSSFGYRVAHNFISVLATVFLIPSFIALVLSPTFRGILKKEKPIIVYTITFFIASAILPAVILFPGGEVYFVWYSIIMTSLIGTWFIEHFLQREMIFQRLVGVTVLSLSVAFFVAFVFGSLSNPWRQVALGYQEPWDQRATVSLDEWDAMQWLKENAVDGAVVVSDRRGFDHEGSGEFRGRFFGYSAISGLQFYNEGDDFGDISHADEKTSRWNQVHALLSSDSIEEVTLLWQTIDADYVLQSLRFSDTLGAGFSELFEPIFYNDDVVVYQSVETKQ